MIISCSILLRMINVSDKSCRENPNTHFNNFFGVGWGGFENHEMYEKKYHNIVEPGRPQTTIWRMRISRWIPKATNTHSEYIIPLFH